MSGFHEGLLSGSQKSQETRTKHMKQVVWTIRPSFSSVKMIIVPTEGILLYFCLFIGCYRSIDDTSLIGCNGCGLHQLLSGSSEEVQRWKGLNSHFVVGCIIRVFGGTSIWADQKAFSAAVSNIMLDVAVTAIITVGARLTGVSVAPKL